MCNKEHYHKKVKDTTCCIHAEQRAIMDALKNHPDKISGARLYFIRLDEQGNPSKADKPYCTICSKMTLDVGIEEFVLWHREGICVYGTDEYNTLSFAYTE
jgi:deoxycytidylate deaminase